MGIFSKRDDKILALELKMMRLKHEISVLQSDTTIMSLDLKVAEKRITDHKTKLDDFIDDLVEKNDKFLKSQEAYNNECRENTAIERAIRDESFNYQKEHSKQVERFLDLICTAIGRNGQ